MSGSANKAFLIGNVGRDPEFKATASAGEMATFSIATSESWRDKATGERKERTEWHRIVVFNDHLVEKVVRPMVKKGVKVVVEGAIRTRSWNDKKAGVERYSTEIVLEAFRGDITVLTPGGEGHRPDPSEYGTTRTREDTRSYADRRTAEDDFQRSKAREVDDEIPF